MDERKDLRSLIVPTVIGNTDESGKTGNKEFDTTELFFLDSYEDLYENVKLTDKERIVSPTDYAIMNRARVNKNHTNRLNQPGSCAWLRNAHDYSRVYLVRDSGNCIDHYTDDISIGLRPLCHLSLTPNREQYDIREVRDDNNEVLYHTLQIGEYPKTKVNEEESQILESLYHGGKLKEGLIATGRWYSGNGADRGSKFAGKHDPEFEHNGSRYVRVVSNQPNTYSYSDGINANDKGTIRWVKVEPISFIIRNWDEMPQYINANGTGQTKYFDLQSEHTIISGVPFYPHDNGVNNAMWQNSSVRGFLNGIDVMNIKENGNIKYTSKNGGNYTGECNFLNEAFNLTREPMLEYTILESETEIPDNAFNGCITLNKLTIHSNIEKIGKNAFEGCNFKYAYRLKSGELVLAERLPEKEEYEQVIELEKLARGLTNLDYGLILDNDVTSLLELSEKLDKSKFSIPYLYVKQLEKSENLQSFIEDSDFRFFRNEIPKINDLLLDFPEEEKLDFFKFATAFRLF